MLFKCVYSDVYLTYKKVRSQWVGTDGRGGGGSEKFYIKYVSQWQDQQIN